MTPVTSRKPSQRVQRPASATFADTGPMTHSRNAEKDPRNAIIELNSGTRIETVTDTMVKSARSMVVKIRFRARRRSDCGVASLSTRGELDFDETPWSSGDAVLVSMPRMISSVMFSYSQSQSSLAHRRY